MAEAANKSKWPRRIRIGLLGMIGLLLLAMPVGWVISVLPEDRPDPPEKQTQAQARTINVIPPEAKLPWTRDVSEPMSVSVNEARSPWKRDVRQSPENVHVSSAQSAWTRSVARAQRVDVVAASTPWAK